jgi:eukaryotic-like serine/threonine-protein kinase
MSSQNKRIVSSSQDLSIYTHVTQSENIIDTVAPETYIEDLPIASNNLISIENWQPFDQERYQKIEHIGEGGMGIVYHVYDHLLHRDLAIKVLNIDLVKNSSLLKRFIEEARLCAWLQHPSIISIHEFGLWDHQPAFLMDLVEGNELRYYIKQLHQDMTHEKWTSGAWSFRRLLEALYQVSMTINFTHQKGVIHRDLKPQNIMLGLHGQVLVLDWGIAKPCNPSTKSDQQTPLEKALQPIKSSQSPLDWQRLSVSTHVGVLAGTPAYMSPEQAYGDASQIGPWSDVYGLGTILYEIMSGRAPYQFLQENTDQQSVIEQIRQQAPSPLYVLNDLKAVPAITHDFRIPQELIELCQHAMSRSIKERITNANEFAQRLRDILDGTQRREKALAFIKKAKQNQEESIQATYESKEALKKSQDLLNLIPSWESAYIKQQGWELEDQAQQAQVLSQYLYSEQFRLLQQALAQDDTCIEAHQDLAFIYLDRHRQEELQKNLEKAHNHEADLRFHLSYLPMQDPVRKRIEVYLYDYAKFQLYTVTPAYVDIFRYDLLQRRLSATSMSGQLESPIHHELPIGSYIARIFASGYKDVWYPFNLKREKNWIVQKPNQEQPYKIPLISQEQSDEQECYIPAGYFASGGDLITPNSAPARTVWLDGYVIHRTPVTHRDFLEFLNDLLKRYSIEIALRWVPRQQASDNKLGESFYKIVDHRFIHPQGELYLNYPVVLVTWYAACVYASWKEEKDGKPWRLPLELEWEKSVRGVDGRAFPWGEYFDPSWCAMMDSHSDGSKAKIYPVGTFKEDVSVYGVRDGAGNIREWCLDLYYADGAQIIQHIALFPTQTELTSFDNRASRGGSAGNHATRTRCADRDWWFPYRTYIARGFRLAYSYPIDTAPALPGLLHYLDSVPEHPTQ